MMEQSSIEPPLTAIEAEVVEFMESLRLSRLLAPTTRRLAFSWGHKRRRSAIDLSPSPPTKKPNLDAASSPATTLAFPPSESEGKFSNPTTTTTSKLPKKIETLHKLCDSLGTQNQALLQEIAKVRSYFLNLKQEQLHLKERLSVEKEKQQFCLELEPAMRLEPSISNQVPYIVHHHHHQEPLIVDRAAEGGLFDLNVLPAEATAAARWVGMAAAARLNRKKRKEKIQQRNRTTRVPLSLGL